MKNKNNLPPIYICAVTRDFLSEFPDTTPEILEDVMKFSLKLLIHLHREKLINYSANVT